MSPHEDPAFTAQRGTQMSTIRSRAGLALLASLILVAAACSGGPGPSGARSDVQVTLKDFSMELSDATVPAGEVRLAIANQGANIHEVEVFTLPDGVDPNSLSVTNSVADTDSAGLAVIDEVEDIAPSTSATLPVTLQPGRYALICNLPTHYQLGMHATLTVE